MMEKSDLFWGEYGGLQKNFVKLYCKSYHKSSIKCYKFAITFKTQNKNQTESVNLLNLSELNKRRVIKLQRGFIDKRRANVGQSNICSDGRKKEATIVFFSFFQAFLVGSWASFQSMKYKEKKNSKGHYDQEDPDLLQILLINHLKIRSGCLQKVSMTT